jgi:hypothetical protein
LAVLASAVASLTAVATIGWTIASAPAFAVLKPMATRANLAPLRSPINPIAQLGRERPDFFEQGDRQLEEEINQLQQQRTTPPDPLLRIDPGAEQRWQPLLLRQAGIAVWLPAGIMTNDVKTLETAAGPLRFQSITSNMGEARFVVAYVEQVSATQVQNPPALYAAVRDAIVRETGGQLKTDRAVAMDGNSGREITLQSGNQITTFRVLLVGQRLYLLATTQNRNSAESSSTATTFFNSLQLLERGSL